MYYYDVQVTTHKQLLGMEKNPSPCNYATPKSKLNVYLQNVNRTYCTYTLCSAFKVKRIILAG